jgi:hypothetical protein
MLKSKVIEIFGTFSPAEMKSFYNYINSPFHNSNKKVIKLYELIKKHYPELSSAGLEKETLFKKLYPGKEYSDIVMRILISDMLRLSEEFLAYQKYSGDYLAEKKYLLEELKERKLVTLFNRHIKEAELHLGKEGTINNTYFLQRFNIEAAQVNFLIATDKQHRAGEALLKQGEYLVDFFLMNGLTLLQELNEHKEVLNAKFDFNLIEIFFENLNIDNIVRQLKQKNNNYYPVIEIYYYLYRFYKNGESDEYYSKLKNSVMSNLWLFNKDEQYNLLLGLESCSVTRLKYGKKKRHEELMEVYERMLSLDLFSGSEERKFMQANLFRNIFYTGVLLKRYQWAEDFVSEYSEYLVPEQRPDMYNYTIALLGFERKDYNNALENISKVNYRFFIFKYEAKVLMLKIYYEMGSFEPALSMIDSFAHFLSNNKLVSEIYKGQFMDFLKFLRILIKHKTSAGKDNKLTRAELLKQAESTVQFASKGWIIEKIHQLKD